MQAASEELAEHGYVALAIERIAERAGVNKTTIYRRWPNKRDLVATLIQNLGGEPPRAPNTGAIASDLWSLARATRNRWIEYHRRGLSRVLLTLVENPEVAELGQTLREQLREPWRQAILAGIERGELPAHTDTALIVEVIISSIAQRVARQERAPDDEFLQALVTLVLDGARAAAT